MYKKSEVEMVALEYFKDSLVANVWMDKYALKTGDDSYIELSPNDTLVRMATELATIEKRYPNSIDYDTIYNLLKGYEKFVLGGSPLFGIGNNTTLSTLGNCFVVDSPVDSIGGIFKSDQELAQLMKRRGGVGIDISSLRPKRSQVNNAANFSTGATSFLEKFSNTTRVIAQEGRRGALMVTMDINHPDIEEFITSKDDNSKNTGANISVKVTDEFMTCVEKDTNYSLLFPTEPIDDYSKVEVIVKAKVLWNKLIHQAWKNAEPGIIFWDKIINESPADCYNGFKTISTNPCGELPLCAYDSCRLSAINLYAYVINPFTDNSGFDLETLGKDVIIYQRLMDDIIDLESAKIVAIIDKIVKDPEDDDIKKVELDLWTKIHNKLLLGRRTGLGQMGLADAMAALGLKYGEGASIQLALEINRIIAVNSYKSSVIMAKERGAFPMWSFSKETTNPYLQRIFNEIKKEESTVPNYWISWLDVNYPKYGRRNIANLTIAPTGSISMLAGVTSGIEPVFALSYKRKRKVTVDNPNKKFQDKQGDWWEEYEVFHPKFQQWLDTEQFENGPIIKTNSPYSKATAYEIDPYTKLKLQSVIQPWIDHSISVTYNLAKETTEEQVSKLYFEAWKLGLKGLTVYRDGCREGILTTMEKFPQHDGFKRPKDVICDVYNIKAKGQDWKVFIGVIDNLPYEVFAVNGAMEKVPIEHGILRKRASGVYDFLSPEHEVVRENITLHMTPEEEALTRMISWALRHGSKLQFGVEQLDKSKGDVTSFSKAISRTLKKYIKDGTIRSGNCPDCGSVLISEGGCLVCKECGYSKCM